MTIKKVRGSMETVPSIEVNVDTVYLRFNDVWIETEDFTGWEYDEIQYEIRKFMELLASIEDVGMTSMMIALLMSEVDMLRSRVEELEGM